ncbi:fimbrial protein [Kosakonia sacchari]|uniref:fimbrial protein n=1 Tax=Kosakonia sacchari TaxID=1158459 RepID=UPI002ACECA49|nr:fimbrial protein [Kosakonia sacchari]MDZ7320055.1 fimbrial protein [Kosakonia sacchari]
MSSFKISYLKLLPIFFSPFYCHGLMAGEVGISFRGTLIEPPPCVINNDETIYVDFGDEIITTLVDGQNYKKKIEFSLDCSSTTSTSQKIRISSTSPASFDETSLATDINGLGISLLHDGTHYNQGEWLPFEYPAVPVFEAVLIKQSGVSLNTGVFHATASLIVDYQ